MIEQIAGADFDTRVRHAAGPVVVDFFGKQCPPCTKLLPILEEVATRFAGRATFVKVDVEDAEEIAVELGVFSLPTVIFFKQGAPVDKLTGVAPKATLAARLEDLLDRP